MKKIMIALFLTLGICGAKTYADIGIVNEITYTNHSFATNGNTASFPENGEADITLTVQNASTAVPIDKVWVYLKFPSQQFWRPKRVLIIPAGFILEDSLNSGNETILKFRNNVALPAPAGPPVLYTFVVRGIAIANSGNQVFTGNFANMEYVNGLQQGVTITPNSIQGITKSTTVTSTPLPISLSNFSGYAQNSTSVLLWNSASEKNNKGFDIERSADSKTFHYLGYQSSLAPNGNSTENIAYTHTDLQPLAGANYYRLKQTDLDGTFAYSKVIKISFGGSEAIRIFPNPATNRIVIEAGNVSNITVCNVLGQVVNVPVNYGTGIHEINTTALASGNYTVRISNGEEIANYKIVVKH